MKLWLPVLLWMAIIFVGSSVSHVPHIGGKITDGLAHRIVHLVEFAILGALLLRATSDGRSISKREIIITLIIIALYGASDEFHQRFTPGRSSEGLAVLFDIAGGAVGLLLYRQWKKRALKVRPDASSESRSLESH